MNRRRFVVLSLSMLATTSGCFAFRLGWRTGGLCSRDASDVEVNFHNNSMKLIDILRIGRVKAETNYLDARKRGFQPGPGAIISNALDESRQFIELLHSGSFKITESDKDIDVYKEELCHRSCLPPESECTWTNENEEKLKALIEYASSK